MNNKKKILIITTSIFLAAAACSKSSDSAAAAATTASSGGSGLDGTGVFTFAGATTQLTNITVNGTGGAQTFTPSGGIPATAKFIVAYVTCGINVGAPSYLASGEFFIDLRVDDDTASTVNELSGLMQFTCPIPTSSSISQNFFILIPTYATAFSVDLRGKTSLKFYQNAGASHLATGGNSITVAIAGFVC